MENGLYGMWKRIRWNQSQRFLDMVFLNVRMERNEYGLRSRTETDVRSGINRLLLDVNCLNVRMKNELYV